MSERTNRSRLAGPRAGARGLLHLVATLLVGSMAACSAPPRPRMRIDHNGLARQVKGPDELLGKVDKANYSYAQMKTVHAVTLVITPNEDREEKRFLRGVLAVRRPDLFRLVVLGPGGIKLMDILYGGGRHKVLHLAPGLGKSSLLPGIVASLCADIRAIYNLTPAPPSDRRVVEETVAVASRRAPLFDIKEYRGVDIVRRLTVFASTMAISRLHEEDRRGESRTITFGDYESDGQRLIPMTIHVARSGSLDYWLLIRVKQISFDEELDDRLFQS